ncbi:hypothetical protein AKJ09_00320 [Labilithrix luteola]|uniref:Uncharacterized protein n=1 Tax=Labilithrix luteola TaxID=1391654 RepID=A0A0K1PJR4_9BACT|nr:HAD domain-containing protein [Labilithrix luteola]AKU93656.1 hypothetical protein AKJ09_00320 [Labilithrix luteola]
MRIVFLDFDGVLNWRAHVESSAAPTTPGPDLLADSAVRRVERLCAETQAGIVVSSTWRLSFDRPTLEEMLRAKGLETTPVLDVSPLIPHKQGRGQEIQSWLDTVPPTRGWTIEGLVILDDQSDMLHLTPWLVLSSFETGFTDAHLLAAKSVLASPAPCYFGDR